jgi:hypothetical protein
MCQLHDKRIIPQDLVPFTRLPKVVLCRRASASWWVLLQWTLHSLCNPKAPRLVRLRALKPLLKTLGVFFGLE